MCVTVRLAGPLRVEHGSPPRPLPVARATARSPWRADATPRVLQGTAVAGDAAEVADGVMRRCGVAAFRKEVGIERWFRDALAARVMAPTTEALHDFVGRAVLGLPLFEDRSGH